MILVDTSIWIDHLRSPEPRLQALLDSDAVLGHPLVTMELALGSIANRHKVLASLSLLPQAQIAELDELFRLIEDRQLHRRGIGITDLHLLASALLGTSVLIWTRDRRLGEIASTLGVLADTAKI
jgi:hypothetical protein